VVTGKVVEVAEPVRMCVGCRVRSDKSDLVRLAWNGRLVVDVAKVQPGRGAYLHRDPQCLQLAIRRRAVARALRVSSVDLDEGVLEGIE
jgi:uncharacterized protein